MNNNSPSSAENSEPIFSITLSYTGTQLVIDSTRLNVLISAAGNSKEIVEEIEKILRCTYKQVTPLLEELLACVFGSKISKNETRSVSESTIFFIGGDIDD